MDRHAIVDGESILRMAKSTDIGAITIAGGHARVNAMQAF
jgi:hypothetical protein